MNLRDKIIPMTRLPEWRAQCRRDGIQLVVTNGCFDLLHAGHVCYLEEARAAGDALLVGLNSDASIRQLKGDQRPLTPQQDRAIVLAGLQSVSAICIFEERDASRFLELAQPDCYAKGGDYTLESLNQQERKIIERAGGRFLFVPLLPGRSTSALLEKLQKL